MRVNKRTVGGTREVLRHKDFTAIPVMIDGTVEADGKSVVEAGGRKIVKAGTILGGKTTPIIDVVSGIVVPKNDEGAEGVLRYDVDITNGSREASLIIRGDIAAEKLPVAPATEAKEAMKSRILFIKS